MHDRIANQCGIENMFSFHSGFPGDLADQRVDPLANRIGHLRSAVGIHHRVGNPAHQILAEPDLRIHHARRCKDRTGPQFTQVSRDRGRPEVNCQTIVSLSKYPGQICPIV